MNFFESRREELKLSQRALADVLGVSNTAVSNWEHDEVVPALEISALAAGYKVSESRIERELIALRRRIEERKSVAAGK
jgi:transcriptional regulator with XRE-family HTH domain